MVAAAVVLAVGLLAIAWAVLASRGQARELWTGRGFLGAPRECRLGWSDARTCWQFSCGACAQGSGRWR